MKNNIHLWNIEHPYYCSEGNYFNNECHIEYDNFQSFINEWSDADEDYNLLFRFDWEENTLKLYYMMQRKAFNKSIYITVNQNDEPLIYAFLEQKYTHLQSLWTPFSSNNIKINADSKLYLEDKIKMHQMAIDNLNIKKQELEKLLAEFPKDG